MEFVTCYIVNGKPLGRSWVLYEKKLLVKIRLPFTTLKLTIHHIM